MTPISIRGMAVHCALGPDRAKCVQRLQDNLCPAPEKLVLPEWLAAQPLHFYPLDGGGDPLAPERMDRILSPVIESAMQEAGLDLQARRTLPVFLGSSCFNVRDSEQAYAQACRRNASDAIPLPYVDMSDIACRASAVIGSHGPDFSFNTACSSAANALLAATRYLQAGLGRYAMVVGVELANLTSLAGFASLQLLSEAVRPFGQHRSGIVLGEGVGVVILEAGGDSRLHLRGGISRVDTFAVSTANPDGHALAGVMRQAARNSRVELADIRAVKAHATSTPSNDEAEARALHHLFSPLPPICTLKPWTGHTLGACGAVELVLFASALTQGFLPGAPGVRPDPDLNVMPVEKSRPAQPGHYLLNQFGFGGNNSVLTLELAC